MLLTSTGLSNRVFVDIVRDAIAKKPGEAHAIFVPSAANDERSREMLSVCLDQLHALGLPRENILTYDLERPMTVEEGRDHDLIYFAGGSTIHLLNRINESGFAPILDELLNLGLFYVGVSAGSKIAGNNNPGSLDYLGRRIELHCDDRSPCGPVSRVGDKEIRLGNDQGLLVNGDEWEIICGEQ